MKTTVVIACATDLDFSQFSDQNDMGQNSTITMLTFRNVLVFLLTLLSSFAAASCSTCKCRLRSRLLQKIFALGLIDCGSYSHYKASTCGHNGCVRDSDNTRDATTENILILLPVLLLLLLLLLLLY
jgi:hypothetical protein